MNNAILIGLIAGLSGSLLSGAAYADGLTATGDTLPIAANGTTVLTVTGGSNPSSYFHGPVNIDNTFTSTGIVNAPAGINIDNNSVLSPNGNAYFSGNETVIGDVGIATTSVHDTGIGLASSVLALTNAKILEVNGDIVTDSGHIISNYQGAPTLSNLNAGSLVLDAGPYSTETNTGIYFRSDNVLGQPGYAHGDYKDLMFIRGDGKVGIGTTDPTGTLDVENSTNNAKLCLNGTCVQSLSSQVSANSISVTTMDAWNNLVNTGMALIFSPQTTSTDKAVLASSLSACLITDPTNINQVSAVANGPNAPGCRNAVCIAADPQHRWPILTSDRGGCAQGYAYHNAYAPACTNGTFAVYVGCEYGPDVSFP